MKTLDRTVGALPNTPVLVAASPTRNARRSFGPEEPAGSDKAVELGIQSMAEAVGVPTGVIRSLRSLSSFDAAGADDETCSEAFRALKSLRGWSDAIEAAVIGRSRGLADEGRSRDVTSVQVLGGGMSRSEARRKQRRAQMIDDAPVFGELLQAGSISAEHIDVLNGVVNGLEPKSREALLTNESDRLAGLAETMTPDLFRRAASQAARRFDVETDTDAKARRDTYLTYCVNSRNGMYEGRFALHPELGHKILRAINGQVTALIKSGELPPTGWSDPNAKPSRRQLAAEALGVLVESTPTETSSNTVGTRVGSARQSKADIVVMVGPNGVVTSDLAPLPAATLDRLTCDSTIWTVRVNERNVPIDVGRRHRQATHAQRHALRVTHQTCAMPGCSTSFDECHIHHIDHWEHGGLTDLENLVPLCSHHHHQLHDHNWEIALDDRRRLVVTRTGPLCRE